MNVTVKITTNCESDPMSTTELKFDHHKCTFLAKNTHDNSPMFGTSNNMICEKLKILHSVKIKYQVRVNSIHDKDLKNIKQPNRWRNYGVIRNWIDFSDT